MKRLTIAALLALLMAVPIMANHSFFDYFYNGDASPYGAFLIGRDMGERCQLQPLLPTFPDNIRVKARIQTYDSSVNWIARLRDPLTRDVLLTLDIPEDNISTLHEVSSELKPFNFSIFRRKYLVCVAVFDGRATAPGAVGYDANPFKSPNNFLATESWLRVWNSWYNTTSYLGDLAIWLEYW